MRRSPINQQNPAGPEAGASDLIDRYLDGLLSEPEREEFEARCFRDDAFFVEVREREELRQKVAKVINEEGAEIFGAAGFHSKIWGQVVEGCKRFFVFERRRAPRWGYALATAGVVAVIGLWFYQNLKNNQETGAVTPLAEEKTERPTSGEPKDSTSLQAEDPAQPEINYEQLYAANFTPAPHLENWLEETMRSESAMIDSVYSPRRGQKIIGKEIIFHWRMTARAPVSLRIQTNSEKELFATEPDWVAFPDLKVRVKTEILKEPGLYYWKIEDANDVLFVGKFIFLPPGNKLPGNKFPGSKLKSPEGDSISKGK